MCAGTQKSLFVVMYFLHFSKHLNQVNASIFKAPGLNLPTAEFISLQVAWSYADIFSDIYLWDWVALDVDKKYIFDDVSVQNADS